MSTSIRSKLLVTTLLASLASVASPTWAQSSPPPVPASPGQTPSAPADSATLPQAVDAAGTGQAGEVVVTGTRIASPNMQSASPITSVSGDELKLQGTTRVEDLVNQLPQAFASQTSGVANGASGIATINLRNFGTDRTLVLVNGRRVQPGDPSGGGSAVDVNFIPSFMVKRIDVLTGGASATYGADAVAGVVNFVLDDDLQGFRIDLQGSVADHNNSNHLVDGVIAADPRYTSTTNPISYPTGHTTDNGTYDVGLAFGTKFNDDRGHMEAYFSYHRQDAVLQNARDYSACPLGSNTTDVTGVPTTLQGEFYCAGSSNSAQTNFLPNSGAGSRIIVTPGSSGPAGTAGVRPYAAATDGYDYNPTNYIIRPDERYNAGFSARYEINDAIKPYMNFMFMDDESLAQIAPSGTFNNVFTVNCNNQLATPAQLTALGCVAPGATSTQTVASAIAKRNVEGGGRIDDLRHTDYRIVLGSKGQLAPGISYDAYGQYGVTDYSENYKADFSRTRVQNAINGCITNTGAAVADQACVPYNIFTGTTTVQGTTAAGVTQGALNYVESPGFKSGTTKETVIGATFNADLGHYGFKSPFATDGVTLAFGPEYRREALNLNTDVEYQTGDLLGQGGQTKPVSGNFHVIEGFVEALVPLVQDKPGFQNLSFDGAYRRSHYSTIGDTDTYKLELSWAPFSGDYEGLIRFRGSFNQALRAPTVQDFFQASQLGLGGSLDPCAVRSGGRASNQSLASCLLTANGDPNFAAQFANGTGIARNPASQYNSITEGAAIQGTNLLPETAYTKTGGIVLEPRHFVPGLVISADYYNLNLKNSIGRDGFDTILQQCLNTGEAYYCNLIHRDPANGSLWLTPNGYITDPIYNTGRNKTSGIDIAASYSRNVFGAKTSLSFNGSYLLNNKIEVLVHNADGSLSSNGFYDCKGYYGAFCGVPNPVWRHRFRATVAPSSQYAISLGWRHIGPTNNDAANNDPATDGSGPLIGQGFTKSDLRYLRIPSYDYFDLAVNFYPVDRFKLTLGVNNIADRDPPIIPGADLGAGVNNGNTYVGYYDQLGRTLFAGMTINF